MAKPRTTKTVHQFKITLQGIEPPIWRSIQIASTASFWDLHVAIQDAMGWMDCHLHEFQIGEARIGIPDEDWGDNDVLPGWKTPITDHLHAVRDAALYTYDFGDDWEHQIVLEKIEPASPEVNYPHCVAGKRRCPPEDCGGPWGYENLLKALANLKHPEHAEMVEWTGGSIDPEDFDPQAVEFENPKDRLATITG